MYCVVERELQCSVAGSYYGHGRDADVMEEDPL